MLVKRRQVEPEVVEKRTQMRSREDLQVQLRTASTPDARAWAARDLRQYPESWQELAGALGHDAHPAVREAILSSLVSIGGKHVAAELAGFLRSEDAALRSAVIEVLSDLPDEMAALIDGLLGDADSDVRLFAVDILRDCRHESTPEWLLRVVEHDPHINVVVGALEAFGNVQRPDLAGRLARSRARFAGDPYYQFAIDHAVDRLASS